MGNKNSHINQHFIPRFLLEEWAGKDKKLGVFKRIPNEILKYDRRAPKSVAKIEHLYSIRSAKFQPDVFIEKDILGPHVDDIAAPIHKKLLKSGVEDFSDEQRYIWSRLLVAGMFRLPFMVEHFRAIGIDRVRMLRGDAAATQAEARDEGLKEFVGAIGDPKYNFRMRSAKWWTVHVPHGKWDALTGDIPFIYLGDFFKDEFSLVMPISPKQFFICASGVYIEKVSQMNPAWMVRSTNKRIIQHASRYVYTTDRRHEGLVEKWLTSRR